MGRIEYEKMYAAMHPSRLEIMKKLAAKKSYASKLERQLGMNRRVVTFHLSMLQKYGLVTGEFGLENPPKGRPIAVKYFELTEEGKRLLGHIKKACLVEIS